MQTVFEALARHVKDRPDDIAFAGDGESLTWAQLAASVSGYAQVLKNAPACVAIGLPGGCSYVVADLALALTGRRQVPLPFFFGAEQLTHVLRDARPGAVITDRSGAFGPLPILPPPTMATQARPLPKITSGSERVIYTSGSSGHPKGVVIGARQLTASLDALLPLTGARETDRHLSVLPMAQLLEQICGLYLPILAGARVQFDFQATKALFSADIRPLADAFERDRPTTSLLVPGLLSRWVSYLKMSGRVAPDSLRFVAVGGAASAPSLLRDAWACAIPVHEGYGLSECCAVVAMNAPGANISGSAGKILDGLTVEIEDGEIVVSGPTVMTGYLNGPDAPNRWHTGDLGRIENGRLFIDGRKDSLLVMQTGRNISPEWIEQRANADPRILCSALGLRLDGALVLVAVAAAPIMAREIAALLADLPTYAKPHGVILVGPQEPGLVFAAGTPNRSIAAKIINERDALPLDYQNESLAS